MQLKSETLKSIEMMNHVLPPLGGANLADGLIQTYLNTDYRIHPSDLTEGFTLHIGAANDKLRSLMGRFNRRTAAFITAFNPLGKSLMDEDNQTRHLALKHELVQRSLPHWPGVGIGRDDSWPGEESFLVLGLELAAAQRLATMYEQNAFVWVGFDAVPKLVLLR